MSHLPQLISPYYSYRTRRSTIMGGGVIGIGYKTAYVLVANFLVKMLPSMDISSPCSPPFLFHARSMSFLDFRLSHHDQHCEFSIVLHSPSILRRFFLFLPRCSYAYDFSSYIKYYALNATVKTLCFDDMGVQVIPLHLFFVIRLNTHSHRPTASALVLSSPAPNWALAVATKSSLVPAPACLAAACSSPSPRSAGSPGSRAPRAA